MSMAPFSILHPAAWSTLQRRLDGAGSYGRGASSRDVLLRPLQLLELMAVDAPGALGDDVLAADRLRMLLYLATAFHSMVDEARALAESGPQSRDSAGYEPGVLDHGAL